MLADAARKTLVPLGFWRKERSRVWLADRDFWLAVVEFQPSGFSKGTYLHVAAHWLWHALPGVRSFDYLSVCQGRFSEFVRAQQFVPAAERLAEDAAAQSRDLVA